MHHVFGQASRALSPFNPSRLGGFVRFRRAHPMFALLAAALLTAGVIVPDIDPHSATFWLLLGVAAIALHLAFPIDVRRR